MIKSKGLSNASTKDFLSLVREVYGSEFIPLHRPIFSNEEKTRVSEVIDSNFVSSAGREITVFEKEIASFVGSSYGIATVNGTAALHIALKLAGVDFGTEVLTQSVSFVATANAIKYCGGKPVFIDVDRDSLGLSPTALRAFFETNVRSQNGQTVNINTGARISACVPMHTFGHPVRIHEIERICHEFNVPVVEDCAESLGSYVDGRHTGVSGKCGTLSFNGNKIITTGGGGMIFTDDEEFAMRAKHLTTTAKRPHPYEYFHDDLAYNYRMPNLNAALGLAQKSKLDFFLEEKRRVAEIYCKFFNERNIRFVWEREGTNANFWFNSIILKDIKERNKFLEETNSQNVMTRPLWQPLHQLPMYKDCQTDLLENTIWLADRLVNIPSSVPDLKEL